MSFSEFAELMKAEVFSAREKFGPFQTTHEGYAVLKEEVDELWDCVKRKNRGSPDDMLKECVQIAAMAACFAIELCTDP
jgi:NTP pyrophosphatase (non-canonical NTP hydrolase)